VRLTLGSRIAKGKEKPVTSRKFVTDILNQRDYIAMPIVDTFYLYARTSVYE